MTNNMNDRTYVDFSLNERAETDNRILRDSRYNIYDENTMYIVDDYDFFGRFFDHTDAPYGFFTRIY